MSEMDLNYETYTEKPIKTDVGASQEWLKAAILVGLAAYFAFNIANGNITNYVNERFSWLSYIAVLIFLALGGAVAIAAYQRHQAPRGYSHTPITWSILGIVAIPLVLGLAIPSKPLGADAVNGNISVQVASVDVASALAKDPLTRNILDWLRAFTRDGTDPASFDGQPADLIGFVYREPAYPENYFMVTRFTMSCCVADAGAIGLPVYVENADDFADGEWVRIQGQFFAGQFDDTRIPILQARSVEITEQPEHPYLYP